MDSGEKPKTKSRRAAHLQPGKILRFKNKVDIPPELQLQGIGPFTVLRKEGTNICLSGGRSKEFQISTLKAIKFFEPCQLRIC